MRRGGAPGKDGGGEGDKVMGPLFPRLHVNDTALKGGGPRAPPRNKMALYEQFSVPSQRFNAAAKATAPHRPAASYAVSSASAGQDQQRYQMNVPNEMHCLPCPPCLVSQLPPPGRIGPPTRSENHHHGEEKAHLPPEPPVSPGNNTSEIGNIVSAALSLVSFIAHSAWALKPGQ